MTHRTTVLAQIKSVPSMPSVVMELRQYLNDPDVSFDKLARVIEHDPGLTVNVLQLANSAYFGWSRSISSVKEAITRLGTNRVFQMVLCMSVAPLVRKPIRGYDNDSDGLWTHAIATAICAEQLAIALKRTREPEIFTAGLLHDMGKIVLGTFVEIDDAPIKDLVASSGMSFAAAEEAVLGIDHAEVAAELLQSWNLPANVVAAARWHHAPGSADAEHHDLVDLIHVADYCCQHFGFGISETSVPYPGDEAAHARLGLTVDIVAEVEPLVAEGLDELGDLFGSARKAKPVEPKPSVV